MKVRIAEDIAERKAEIVLYGMDVKSESREDVKEFMASEFRLNFNWEDDIVFLRDVKKVTNTRCISIDDLFKCFVPTNFAAKFVFFVASVTGRKR